MSRYHHRVKHWATNLGIVLIAIAVTPYGYVQYRLRSHDWTPLDAVASLNDGTTTLTADFPTDLTGFYNVNLTFAPVNVELEECLVGDRLFNSCDKTQNGLDLDWSVLRTDAHGEVPVVQYQCYRPASFGGAGYVGTVLGGFDAHKGDKYRIAIRVRQVAPQLRSASPHVRVEAGRIYWEQWVIFAQLTLLFGAVVGLPGFALLITGLLLERRINAEKAVLGG
jgi:hypothetical protein